MSHWAHGYISAYNLYGGTGAQVRGVVPGDSILAYLDKYCRENPLRGIAEGLTEMINELRRR